MKLLEVEKIADFEKPNSILFIIKEDIQHIENLFDFTSQLHKQFEETKIKIHTEFDFKASEKKVLDRDLMVFKNYELDRNNFETEFVLDFTNIKTDQQLKFELKNMDDKILLKGMLVITENKNNSEMNKLISRQISELFE